MKVKHLTSRQRKKRLVLFMPYLVLGLGATKLCQAGRIAEGSNASQKFLHYISGLQAALSSPMPSFHPADMLFGIAVAAALRVAVHIKGQNARKFRKNMEYGSARWGTAEDIAPFIDPVFRNNIILTQTERLTMNNRPKDPAYARNNNVLVIGGSGSGKTRYFVLSNLLQCHSSYVVTDPKGDLINRCGTLLQKKGYRIKVLNTINFSKSMLIVQDQVWGRVTANRDAGKYTRYFMDEFHLLLREEQTANYSVEIWKRFRKWGGIPTGITQNVKDLLASRDIENILENSDYIVMLNQAQGDRQVLAQKLNISPHQLSHVTQVGPGEGLLFYGNVILPFVDHFPKDMELYNIMTTRLSERTAENIPKGSEMSNEP